MTDRVHDNVTFTAEDPIPSYEEATSLSRNVIQYRDPPSANEEYGEYKSDDEESTAMELYSNSGFDDVSETAQILPPTPMAVHRSVPLPQINTVSHDRCDNEPSRPIVITRQSTQVITRQPRISHQMHNPVAEPPSYGPYDGFYLEENQRPWSTAMCSCCMDCRICCCVFFCGCCYAGATAMKLKEDCCVGCCLPAIGNLRTKFRLKHSIQGSVLDDTCISHCCPACIICQMGREMEILNYDRKCGCC